MRCYRARSRPFPAPGILCGSDHGESRQPYERQDKLTKRLEELHNVSQSIWFDNICRALLKNSDFEGYIKNYVVTGLTSNPTIFKRVIDGSGDYDQAIVDRLSRDFAPATLFQELVIEDLLCRLLLGIDGAAIRRWRDEFALHCRYCRFRTDQEISTGRSVAGARRGAGNDGLRWFDDFRYHHHSLRINDLVKQAMNDTSS